MRSTGIRRILAFAVDWLVIAAWGGLLFGAVMLFAGGDPPRPSGPWKAQAIGFIAMTVPVTLYFALMESSPRGATLGKRVLDLRVTSAAGERLPVSRTLLRNIIKFIPWEFGHLVAQQAMFSSDAGMPAWVWVPVAISMLGPLWWVVSVLASGRTPYDRLAGTRVIRAS